MLKTDLLLFDIVVTFTSSDLKEIKDFLKLQHFETIAQIASPGAIDLNIIYPWFPELKYRSGLIGFNGYL